MLVRQNVRSWGVPMPRPFDAEGFVPLVSGRESEWLSIATTMVHEMASCPRESLLDRVGGICADYGEGMARAVLADLEPALPAWSARRAWQ